MVDGHRFTNDEMRKATGLSIDAIDADLKRPSIGDSTRPRPPKGAAIRVLPYGGGRHPIHTS
jgi:hypothetical protein